jgi:ATP-dependent Lon protease
MNSPQDGPDRHAPISPDLLSAVPLFPLPSVVLFPRAVLPLHIFEERYKAMTADVLRGQRQVAMALLKPGWERDYYQKPAIEPVVCVGRILSHERLPDGKYNFLLQGQTRARIARETAGGKPYRVAELEPLCETAVAEAELEDERERLTRIFRPALLGSTPVGRQFRALLGAGDLGTPDVADLIAFNYLDDVRLKQSLLEECDVRRRVQRTLQALEDARPGLQVASQQASGDADVSLN